MNQVKLREQVVGCGATVSLSQLVTQPPEGKPVRDWRRRGLLWFWQTVTRCFSQLSIEGGGFLVRRSRARWMIYTVPGLNRNCWERRRGCFAVKTATTVSAKAETVQSLTAAHTHAAVCLSPCCVFISMLFLIAAAHARRYALASFSVWHAGVDNNWAFPESAVSLASRGRLELCRVQFHSSAAVLLSMMHKSTFKDEAARVTSVLCLCVDHRAVGRDGYW